jgi:GAF domain-containing protein
MYAMSTADRALQSLNRNRFRLHVLCTPLVSQGKVNAVLYLENNLATDVFTEERVALLKLLSTQMAMSIENARIHGHLEQLLEERSIALSTAEAQIRTLFDSSPLGIALSSVEGEFLTVNNALLRMLRITEVDLLHRTVADFYANYEDRTAVVTELHDSVSQTLFSAGMIAEAMPRLWQKDWDAGQRRRSRWTTENPLRSS